MATASPLFDLVVYFRKHQKIPDDWIRRLSAAGELDEAAQAAWISETNPGPMTWLATYFADRRTRTLAAVDLGRMLLPYLSAKQKKLPAAALDFMERWATEPGVPEPKQGWLALADSVEPSSDSDALWVMAGQTIVSALTAPDYPRALETLCEGVMSRKAEELVASKRLGGRRLSEQEIDANDDEAQSLVSPSMVERLRLRIPAPTGTELAAALASIREKGLNEALARKDKRALASYRR